MRLEGKRPQMTRQLELPLNTRGEPSRRQRSEEEPTATSGNERSFHYWRSADTPSCGTPTQELRGYLTGWKEYFRLADTPRIFRELDEWIRHRLRAIHLKHWKTPRTIYRELRNWGISDVGARRVAANGRRWWKNSGKLINVAFPIRYFDELGVPRLAA